MRDDKIQLISHITQNQLKESFFEDLFSKPILLGDVCDMIILSIKFDFAKKVFDKKTFCFLSDAQQEVEADLS